MTDLSKLAAERCAELANDPSAWDATDFMPGNYGGSTCRALYETVTQAHTLATEAFAHPERAAEILAPLILREPVDPDLLIAREFKASVLRERGLVSLASDFIRGNWDDCCAETVAAIKFYRQREGGGNG